MFDKKYVYVHISTCRARQYNDDVAVRIPNYGVEREPEASVSPGILLGLVTSPPVGSNTERTIITNYYY